MSRNKIIRLDERFSTGEPTVQPVVLWGLRSKPYFETLSKEASASPALEYIKHVGPEPGRTVVLILGLGSYEFYGLNRNGDGFNEQPYKPGQSNGPGRDAWVMESECVQHHYKTYEQGHVYRHHCFPAGTLVVLANRQRVPIEWIQEGDWVATHRGSKRVTTIFRRAYEGPGVRLHLRGTLEPLTGTADHPIRIFRRDQIHCRHRYNRLTNISNHAYRCKEYRAPVGDPQEVPLDGVLPGDYLVFPKPQLGTLRIDPALARAVGWLASEGHLGDRGAIQFTFSETNTADINSVIACFAELGLTLTAIPQPQYARVQLTGCSKELHTQLSQYVQGILSRKTLTSAVFHWHPDSVRELLAAYIEGDGHVARTGRNKGQLRIRSSSKAMLETLSDLIRGLGIYTTVNWDCPAGTMVAPTNGQEYDCNGSGCVAVSPTLAKTLSTPTRKHQDVTLRQTTPGLHEDYFLIRVLDREDCFLQEEVFNLEVEDAHHYIAGEVLVHNCNKDPKKAVGRILKAFWNPLMHRIEVLEDLDNGLAPDLVEQIADGQYPAKSMGTRIKFDVCTVCGNMAPTRRHYCDHLKFEMCRLRDDGVRVGALNPSPRFFDSSWVLRPADRTAFMLKKVAEETRPYELWSSSDLGDYVDHLHEKASAAKKLAVIDKVVRGYPAAMVQSELPEAGLVEKYRQTTLPTVVQNTPELNTQDLASLSNYNLADTLSALSRAGIVLTTPEFIQMFLQKAGMQAPPEALERLTAMQGELFELFSQNPTLLDQTLSSFTPSGKTAAVDAAVAPLREKRSTVSEYLYRRLTPNVFRPGQAPPLSELLEVQDPSTGRLYQTTRGAAQTAHDAIAEAELGKMLGGGALLAAAYKVLAANPKLRPFKLPIGAGLGYAGYKTLPPDMGPEYTTTSGETVPYLTEFVEKQSSFADTVNALGQDYQVTTYGPQRFQSVFHKTALYGDTPLYRILRKLASFSPFEQDGLAAQVARFKHASDGIVEERLDFDKVAEVIGNLARGTSPN